MRFYPYKKPKERARRRRQCESCLTPGSAYERFCPICIGTGSAAFVEQEEKKKAEAKLRKCNRCDRKLTPNRYFNCDRCLPVDYDLYNRRDDRVTKRAPKDKK